VRRTYRAAVVAALLAGCSVHAPPSRASAPPAPQRARVVALVPSFADDLYAFGAGSQLVGVSAYTDAPGTASLPRVADAGSVDAEAIVALRPALVVGIPAQARYVEPLRAAGIRVVLLPDDTFAQIFTNLQALGDLTGRAHAAAALAANLHAQTERLVRRASRFTYRPSVFVVLGSAPIWTAGSGSYIATLIALAGGRNAAADLRAPYGQYSAEALLRDRPDVLVTDPASNLRAVLDREPWRSLPAVRLRHVYVVDPDTLERPGPSYNEGLRWLVERLSDAQPRASR